MALAMAASTAWGVPSTEAFTFSWGLSSGMSEKVFGKAAPDALRQVLTRDVGDVPRGEGVQVEAVLDRQDHRLLGRTGKILPLFRIGPAGRHPGGGQSASGGR